MSWRLGQANGTLAVMLGLTMSEPPVEMRHEAHAAAAATVTVW